MLVILLQEMYICEARQSHKEYQRINLIPRVCMCSCVNIHAAARNSVCMPQTAECAHTRNHSHSLVVAVLMPVAAVASLRNVLLITSDDLRTQLGAYGLAQTKTPNLDRLAGGGVTFRRAYCQMAVCSPSRNSFMSGRRPDTTRVWNFVDDFRQPGVGADWITMPEYFKRHGYLTYASGKLYHPDKPPKNDFPASWTKDSANPYYWGNGAPIGDQNNCPNVSTPTITVPIADAGWRIEAFPGSPCYAVSCTRVNDTAALEDHDERDKPQLNSTVEYDHRVATRALEFMAHAVSQKAPFFVAAGFRKPHIPWRVPHRFWDLYEGEAIEVAKAQILGEAVPELAFEMNGPMSQIWVDPQGKRHRESPDGPPLPASLQAIIRRSYYAAVSFVDFEVGRMLDQLDTLEVAATTAVLFHSDHGWKLGEHGAWSKCTNWELDARVPLIVRAPWLGAPAQGQATLALAELVDIYPTLVELSGLPPPPASEGIEGVSLVPALLRPDLEGAVGKVAAFSQYPRCTQYDLIKQAELWECLHIPRENFTRMGYSVRVADARYTEWRVWRGESLSADWSRSGLVATELYDHSGDDGTGARAFDEFEFVNLAKEPSRREQVRMLAGLLRAQFDADGRRNEAVAVTPIVTPLLDDTASF